MAALEDDKKTIGQSRRLKIFIFLLLLTVPLAWRWTSLNEWVNLKTIIEWQQSVKDYPTAFYLVVGAYLLGSLLLFPVTVLNVATVLTFGPIQGNLYALSGWLASAAMGYGIGRGTGREIVMALTRLWGRRLLEHGDRHGFLTVLAMRVVPVAPFTLVNFFFGAAKVRFWDFFLASVIGRIPGIILLTLAGLQVERFLRRPGVIGLVLLGLTLILLPLSFGRLFNRWLLRKPRQPDSFKSSLKS